MKPYYRTEDLYSEKAQELGKKIVSLLVEAEVSYQEADDALSAAQALLAESTRPVFGKSMEGVEPG